MVRQRINMSVAQLVHVMLMGLMEGVYLQDTRRDWLDHASALETKAPSRPMPPVWRNWRRGRLSLKLLATARQDNILTLLG